MKILWLILSILCLSISCIHTPPQKFIEPSPIPSSILESVKYPENNHLVSEVHISTNRTYTIKEYSFQSSIDLLNLNKKPHDITILVYSPTGIKRKMPVVLLSPISGGNYIVSTFFGRFFAREGWTAIIIKRRKIYKEMITIEKINDIVRQIVIDHKQVIDWSEKQAFWDPNKVAMLGVSQGGIKTAIITPCENRIKAACIALAGGDIPYILTHSQEVGLIRRRNAYLKKVNLSLEEFHDTIKARFSYDPLYLAQFKDGRNTLIIAAKLDRCIPYTTGYQLYEALPGSELISLYTGHYSALLTLPYISHKTLQFFKRKLKIQ